MSSFLARGHRPRRRLKIEYLFLFEILSKIDLFMFIVKSMHYAPQLSGIVCAAWKVSGTFTTSATAVTTGKCSKGFEVSSIFCDLLKYWCQHTFYVLVRLSRHIIYCHILNLFNVLSLNTKCTVEIEINILSIIKTCNVAMNVNSNINNVPY